jgi:hypothetical protein
MVRPTFFMFRLRAEPGQEIRDTPPTDELLPSTTTTTTEKKLTLEEKMKSWEATEEERKAASLGGVIPTIGAGSSTSNRERTGVFDVGLYIAFPLMVLSGLAFALFPLIVGNFDVDSVGPPPTM